MNNVIDEYRYWVHERSKLNSLMVHTDELEHAIEQLDAEHHPQLQAKAIKLMNQHHQEIMELKRLTFANIKRTIAIGDELANMTITEFAALGIDEQEAHEWQFIGQAMKQAGTAFL